MSSQRNDERAKLKEACLDALYVHCRSHALNLVLQEAERKVKLIVDASNFT